MSFYMDNNSFLFTYFYLFIPYLTLYFMYMHLIIYIRFLSMIIINQNVNLFYLTWKRDYINDSIFFRIK